MSKFTHDYQNFFLKSNAGKQFVETVEKLKEAELDKAKRSPELARDHIQTYKGIDSVLEHVSSVCRERKPIGAE